jgi:hypothetical protein
MKVSMRCKSQRAAHLKPMVEARQWAYLSPRDGWQVTHIASTTSKTQVMHIAPTTFRTEVMQIASHTGAT